MNMNTFIEGYLVGLKFKLADEQKELAMLKDRTATEAIVGVIRSTEARIAQTEEHINLIQSQVGEKEYTTIMGVKYEVLNIRAGLANIPEKIVLIDARPYTLKFPTPHVLNPHHGNKARIYGSYVNEWNSKHPEAVILPQVKNYFDGAEKFTLEFIDANVIDRKPKYLDGNSFPCTRYQLTDGRVVESTCDNRGLPIYATFPSLKHADSFKKPDDWKRFWNEW